MGSSPIHEPRKNKVALVRWTTKPGDNPVTRFVVFFIGVFALCLILMMFIPILRSFGAVVLFTVFFATLMTIPTVSDQRRLMQGLTKRVNDTVAEVTNTPADQLSVKEFRRMVKSGEQLPLLVSGVPGLNLHMERVAMAGKNSPERWLAVLTVVPPENGTASFDRLVAAAIGPGSGTTRANPS
ncbi:hypothetical protein [Arthrobacter sp. ov118]|uniref:hypothetical protein n=1 Tax=Arthrobacter sp. ov118 TaxID=1761747 RepID=UPI0008F203A4|nr:hypothetical protein [Arthrobacter sp. ov118]SFT68973.1 hypothetical protein SAMN04487915_102239 [Arthrobacter sp. ov118]